MDFLNVMRLCDVILLEMLSSSWFIQQPAPKLFLLSPSPPAVKDNQSYLVVEGHQYTFHNFPYVLCMIGFP